VEYGGSICEPEQALNAGVEDMQVPEQGPFKDDLLDLDISPLNYISLAVILNDLVSSTQCNIVSCNVGIPIVGVIENLQVIASTGLGLLSNLVKARLIIS
jgi:hypothetical protein